VKIASFEIDERPTYGIVQDDGVTEMTRSFRDRYPDLRSVLAADALSELTRNTCDKTHKFNGIRYLPTIPNPDKVLCVGVNYRSHIKEMGREVPEKPVVFVRFSGSQTGHGREILRPRVSERFDFEGELAVIVGRPARHVGRETAHNYIAGYSCFMDGSVRDWQNHTAQFTPGKNFHQSGSMGPYLVTCDEAGDPTCSSLETRVNGELMQEGRLADLVFDIPTLIEYCSTFAELLPGDVIATGTPGGVGAARTPPVWLRDGDRVEVDIGPVGRLENRVVDE